MSRSRDALQRVGTSAPIYAALAERLSSIEGASQSGDGLSRRRGPGGGPRPAAARPLVAGPSSRPQARAAALADVRAAVRERKELQQRQQQEEEQPDQPQPEQQPGSTSSRASSPAASHSPTHQLQRATPSSSPLAMHEPPVAPRLSKEAPMEHAARAIEALESICPLGCDPLDAATIFFGGASLTASALRKRLGLLEAPPLKYSMLERKPLMVRYGLAVEAARTALGEGSKLLRTAPQSLAGLAMERELVANGLLIEVDGDDEDEDWAMGDEQLRAIVERAEMSANRNGESSVLGDWRSMMAEDGWADIEDTLEKTAAEKTDGDAEEGFFQ